MSFASDLDQYVSGLSAQLHAAMADGIDLNDVVGILLGGAMALAQVAQAYHSIPDAKKVRVITNTLKRVYMSRDIDLPWLPEPFESLVEQLIFTVVVPELIALLLAPQSRPTATLESVAERLR